MIDTSDPLERLRAANPVPHAAVVLLRPDPALFDRITTAPPSSVPDPVRGRRRRRRLVPALVATSLLGGAVAYGLLRGEVSNPETVACFEAPDLAAATEVVTVEAAGPVDACAGLWRRGVFEPSTGVPPLVACVLPEGVVGVFPATGAGDPCTALNLAPLSPTPTRSTTTTTLPGAAPAPPPVSPPAADPNTRILNFRDAVLGQFLDSPCMAPAAGAEIVRRELDRAGLSDWTITSGGYTSERPCASLSFRSEERQVVLVPTTPRR